MDGRARMMDGDGWTGKDGCISWISNGWMDNRPNGQGWMSINGWA